MVAFGDRGVVVVEAAPAQLSAVSGQGRQFELVLPGAVVQIPAGTSGRRSFGQRLPSRRPFLVQVQRLEMVLPVMVDGLFCLAPAGRAEVQVTSDVYVLIHTPVRRTGQSSPGRCLAVGSVVADA